jgi:peptidoglycan/LPS O-acetylase OafA/YrhL
VKRLGYTPALDGLRGIAILAVIGVHAFGEPLGGFYGVDLFFVLSGFLITTLLLEEHDRSGGIAMGAFYRRRAYRLLPGLLAVLAVYAALTLASQRALEQIAAGGLYGANFFLASGSHFLDGTPFVPYWSLAQEEQFYLVWPLLLVLLLQRRVRESRVAWALGAVLLGLMVYRYGLAAEGASATRLYYAPDTHANGLVLGCLLALLRRRGLRVPALVGWIGLAALLVAFAFPTLTGGLVFGLDPATIAAALLTGAALEQGLLSRCLSFRPLVWIGLISYSLYLWHFFCLELFDWHAQVALPVAFVVSTVCYYKIERPLRRGFRARAARVVEAQPVPGQA